MNNTYGVVDAMNYDPRTFMIKALKKCILNMKNAEKFIESKQLVGLEQRVINTMQLVQEMDCMLNREEENETVDRLGLLYDWLIRECEKVLEKKEPSNDLKTIKEMIPIFEDLLEGFEGMKE